MAPGFLGADGQIVVCGAVGAERGIPPAWQGQGGLSGGMTNTRRAAESIAPLREGEGGTA